MHNILMDLLMYNIVNVLMNDIVMLFINVCTYNKTNNIADDL